MLWVPSLNIFFTVSDREKSTEFGRHENFHLVNPYSSCNPPVARPVIRLAPLLQLGVLDLLGEATTVLLE